jgi:hypothetical protein
VPNKGKRIREKTVKEGWEMHGYAILPNHTSGLIEIFMKNRMPRHLLRMIRG